MSVAKYIPYVLMFAVATALIYAWGLYKTQRQGQDLSNLLSSKGVSAIQKALKKNGKMTRRELEDTVKDLTAGQPFSGKRLGVTDPRQFVDSLLPYMIRQHLITEVKENNKIYYLLRK